MSLASDFDYVLVGGGLQNGLIALTLLSLRPQSRLALVERAPTLGGNHTWCFHAGDIPAELAPIIDPVVAYRWPGYRVQFPNLARDLDQPYAGTNSERLAAAVTEAVSERPGCRLITGVAARSVSRDRVILESGEELTAELVVDSRGPGRYTDPGGAGYQKFVGLELELERPHGLDRPLLMDATVAQRGGFRFYYLLPLAPDRVLVEDTTFSRDPLLDHEHLEAGCLAYAEGAGLAVARVRRRESGALPMPWEGQHEAPTAPLRGGYQGGWFHPATGYSFPVALRLAHFISGRPAGDVVGPDLAALHREQLRQVRFCHRLNRMLFNWFAEGDEWNVFERFYRLDAGLIRRFYALATTAGDRARLLIGRPPRGFSLRARLARRRSV